MAETWAITWDAPEDRIYETGVDHGVFYNLNNQGAYVNGVAWNGLTNVNETPSGADENKIWADNMKYLSLRAAEDFGLTIQAYTYPEEFAVCDGSASVMPGVIIGQQPRKKFGFCYRTLVGNDVQQTDFGYKLHLVYGCTASPSQRGYSTVNENPEAIQFSWEIATTGVTVDGFKPTACLIIDSTKLEPAALAKLTDLEEVLYGTPASGGAEAVAGRMPLPDEVASILG